MIRRITGECSYGSKHNGYMRIELTRLKETEKRIIPFIHVLVAFVFIGPKRKGYIVNHKDGNKSNNHLNNLEYITFSANSKHAYDNKLATPSCGSKRAVVQLTLKGEFINRFDSVKIAKQINNITNLSKICFRGGVSKNFKWVYEDCYDPFHEYNIGIFLSILLHDHYTIKELEKLNTDQLRIILRERKIYCHNNAKEKYLIKKILESQ